MIRIDTLCGTRVKDGTGSPVARGSGCGLTIHVRARSGYGDVNITGLYTTRYMEEAASLGSHVAIIDHGGITDVTRESDAASQSRLHLDRLPRW